MEEYSKRVAVIPVHAQEAETTGSTRTAECTVPLTAASLHDLAGPVNQVCAMAGLLLKRHRGQLGDEAEAIFGFIENSTNRLHNLFDGLTTYTRVVGSPGPYRHCDGNVLLANSIESIQPAIDKEKAKVTHDALPELYCNPVQIGFTFASLIENAIKFRREEPPEVHISVMSSEETWVFSVKDNGIGIAGGCCERIFGVFARIHQEAYPGAGMGLAIARRVIELHNGRLWVESEVGRGTTFSFTLPQGDLPKSRAIA